MYGPCACCYVVQSLLSRYLCAPCYRAVSKNSTRNQYPLYNPLNDWLQTVQDTKGCWLWAGHKNNNGYGQISINGKLELLHVAVYRRLIGPIPPGKELDHLCRTHHCGNPSDLDPVTHRVNLLRGNAPAAINARKLACKFAHRLSGLNLKTRADGHRNCVACLRAASIIRNAQAKGITLDYRTEADKKYLEILKAENWVH
jgi:hypothetical protein